MNDKLPTGWNLLKLKDAGKIVSGGTPSTANLEYWNGDINWIAPSDLTGYKNKFIKTGAKCITPLGLKSSSAKLIPKGSVLFSSRAPIGYAVIAENEVCTNQGFKSIVPNESVSSEYLYYYLKSSVQLAKNAASGTTFLEISLSKFSELPFPLPPLNIQQSIVSKIEELFSELDKGIENLKLAQKQLKIFRQSVLKWAFEGRLTNDNVENGRMPAGWNIKKLGEICKTTSGGTPSRGNKNYYDGSIPWVKSGELDRGIIYDTQEKITELAVKNSSTKLFPKGTLLIALYGATIGKLAFLGVDAATNQAICGIYQSEQINSNYLYYYLSFMKRSLVSQGIGGAQPNISQTILKNLDVPLSNLKEQEIIVQEIESRLSVADKMEETINQSLLQAESLRQSILKNAFEGTLI